jgi:hypothetical protein
MGNNEKYVLISISLMMISGATFLYVAQSSSDQNKKRNKALNISAAMGIVIGGVALFYNLNKQIK